jgi:hypothetical protein
VAVLSATAAAAWPRWGHKNQQSTKSTETTMMTATTLTIEMKGTTVAAEKRLQRGGSGQLGSGSGSIGSAGGWVVVRGAQVWFLACVIKSLKHWHQTKTQIKGILEGVQKTMV